MAGGQFAIAGWFDLSLFGGGSCGFEMGEAVRRTMNLRQRRWSEGVVARTLLLFCVFFSLVFLLISVYFIICFSFFLIVVFFFLVRGIF